MQSSPNRVSSNPLKVSPIRRDICTVVHRTPHGRVFHCCKMMGFYGKHGRYFLPPLRWEKSLRDHKKGMKGIHLNDN